MRKSVKTTKAPVFPLPFSQAITVKGRLVFASGTVGLNPVSKTVPESYEDEIRQVLNNLCAVLEAAGCAKENVVKCTCFITDVKLFDRFNAVYREYFGFDGAPARSTFEVSGLAGPYRVEIEAIGYVPE